MSALFSRRRGYHPKAEITVREDAPTAVRMGLLQILHDSLRLTYNEIRQVVCHTLRRSPDDNNWTEVPNIRDEVGAILQSCPWYQIYDLVESFYRHLGSRTDVSELYMDDVPMLSEEFARHINQLFEEEGIGWQLTEGEIVTRGSEQFEQAVGRAIEETGQSSYATARSELEEARHDLSRRPEPDITGCIHHSWAALECTCRVLSGDSSATFGDIIRKRAADLGIPKPLDQALEKFWGYASDNARHVREGQKPSREEAELLLTMAAAVTTYLLQKVPSQ